MTKRRTADLVLPSTIENQAAWYPPSWFDRLADWIDVLPGPPWVFYLVIGIAVGIAGSAIEWIEGAYPPGNFNALHVWTLANFAYLLALIHYLDKSAASAIASFRLIIAPAASDGQPTEEGKSTYARLAFQLTTLPSRPALLAAIIGMGFAIVVSALQFSAGSVPSYLVGTAGTALSNASMLVMLTVGNAVSGLLVYHTIHQLALISQIYTRYARNQHLSPSASVRPFPPWCIHRHRYHRVHLRLGSCVRVNAARPGPG